MLIFGFPNTIKQLHCTHFVTPRSITLALWQLPRSSKNILQRVLRCYIFIALALSGAMSNLAMAKSMASQSALAAADIMMLCTGKGMRFVSLSQFVDYGLIVDVSPPTQSDITDATSTVSCPCSHAANLMPALNNDALGVSPVYKKLVILTARLATQTPRLIAFVTPPSRAPPQLI